MNGISLLGKNPINQTSGFYGVSAQNGSSFNPTFESGVQGSSALGAGIGAGISGIGSLLDIGAQGEFQKEIGTQLDMANKQYDLQLQQISLNKDITDFTVLKKANEAYSTQLAQAGANGISPVSSAYSAAFKSTEDAVALAEFSSTLTATTQRLNTYFSKASFAQGAQARLNASSNAVLGDFLSGATSIASALVMLI